MYAALVALLGAARPARAAEPAPAPLAAAERLYASGDYDAASRVLNELLVKDQEQPPPARARLYLMKARLELAYGRQSEIRLWLAKAHAANPQLTLDPVKDPPSLIAAWGDLRPGGGAPTASGGSALGFVVGLLPLGLGHFEAERTKDGALFLTSEALLLLAGATLPNGGDDAAHERARLATGVSLLGAYGYELADLLPDLARQSPDGAAMVRWSLSLAPFGAAQAKNGQTLKALAFGALDAALVTAATLAPDEDQRHAAAAAFGVAWAYGILDGFLNQRSAVSSADFQVTPVPFAGVGGRPVLGLAVAWER
jgi:hypothetical protein